MPKMRGRRKKKKQEEIILTPAEKFEKLMNLKTATRCILKKRDEYEVYASLARDFEELGKTPEEETFEGIEQCAALSEECRKRAEELKAELPLQEEEISRTVTTTVKEQEQAQNKKEKKSRGAWVGVVLVILIIAVIFGFKMSPSRYWIAAVEGKIGLYRYAIESYTQLGDYKDSVAKGQQVTCRFAEHLKKKGDVDGARRQYSRLVDSGDEAAAADELQMEKILIDKAEKGETVVFGSCRWMLLEKREGRALLMRQKVLCDKKKQKAGDGKWSRETFSRTAGKTTWEDSSLRNYLNGKFIKKTFTAREEACLAEIQVKNKKNPVYGTGAGADTTDRVFIFSGEEIEPYMELLAEHAKNIRLRTPGVDQTSTAYVSGQREIIYYGFPVEKKGIGNRPAIWVTYK